MEVYSFSLEISDLRVIMFSVIHLIVFFFFLSSDLDNRWTCGVHIQLCPFFWFYVYVSD